MFGKKQPSACTQTCCTHPEYTVLNLQPENFGLRTTATSTSPTIPGGGGQQQQHNRRNSVQLQSQQPRQQQQQQNQKHKRQQSEGGVGGRGGGGIVEYRNMAEEPNRYLRAVVDIGR